MLFFLLGRVPNSLFMTTNGRRLKLHPLRGICSEVRDRPRKRSILVQPIAVKRNDSNQSRSQRYLCNSTVYKTDQSQWHYSNGFNSYDEVSTLHEIRVLMRSKSAQNPSGSEPGLACYLVYSRLDKNTLQSHINSRNLKAQP